jgi:hypothetical protein
MVDCGWCEQLAVHIVADEDDCVPGSSTRTGSFAAFSIACFISIVIVIATSSP